jgi:hypothetical protein
MPGSDERYLVSGTSQPPIRLSLLVGVAGLSGLELRTLVGRVRVDVCPGPNIPYVCTYSTYVLHLGRGAPRESPSASPTAVLPQGSTYTKYFLLQHDLNKPADSRY